MKIGKSLFKDETFGVVLTAENKEEDKLLQRFWEGGIKLNAITIRGTNNSLQLTFADLMGIKDLRCSFCGKWIEIPSVWFDCEPDATDSITTTSNVDSGTYFVMH